MEASRGDGAALVFKAALCLVFAALATFFVVQVSLGSRDASAGGTRAQAESIGAGLTAIIDTSLDGLLEDLAGMRAIPLLPVWELAVSGEVFLEEEGGCLYLTSNLGQVMAVDAASGNTLWSLDLGVWISSPPAVGAGVVYVGATNHVLYALDAGSGALLWYYTSQGEILAQPVISGDMVFFTADNDSVYDLVHRLYALDARSGTLLWIYDTESWTPSPPAIGEGAVFLGGYRREVYALEKYAGSELWSFQASNIIFSSPRILGGEVLFNCIDGLVYSLDAATGASLWSRKLPGLVWLAPPDGSGNLYACSHRDTLAALAPESGEELWSFTGADLLSCSSLVEEGAVCAFGADGRTYLLDAADGELLVVLRAERAFAGPPMMAGRRIYAVSSDGLVRAYSLPDRIR